MIMGTHAEDLINGDFDSQTGEYIGPGGGFPRTMEGRSRRRKQHKKLFKNYNNSPDLNGIAKYLSHRGYDEEQARKLIGKYCREELNFEGTLRECAEEIQKQFGQFARYTRNTTKENL